MRSHRSGGGPRRNGTRGAGRRRSGRSPGRGQALACYLLDHPDEVAGKRVLDVATGSGLCAIAAMKAGAAYALAADIDVFCAAAVALNARANGVRVAFSDRDLLAAAPPDTDLILAGDICYEQPLAGRALAWLQTAHARGTRVLIGDPGRTYFPRGPVPAGRLPRADDARAGGQGDQAGGGLYLSRVMGDGTKHERDTSVESCCRSRSPADR